MNDPASPPAGGPEPSSPPAAPQPPPAAPGGQIPGSERKLVAGILAIVLGGFGVHKFYLGYTNEGIIMLVVTVAVGFGLTAITCGLFAPAAFAMPIIGVIEGIMYLTKSDDEFVATYVTGRKPWF